MQRFEGRVALITGASRGIGYAIARRIVALHGGRLWVESVPGQGATFRMTVPIRVERQAVLRAGAPS